jgi:hypothetical protein
MNTATRVRQHLICENAAEPLDTLDDPVRTNLKTRSDVNREAQHFLIADRQTRHVRKLIVAEKEIDPNYREAIRELQAINFQVLDRTFRKEVIMIGVRHEPARTFWQQRAKTRKDIEVGLRINRKSILKTFNATVSKCHSTHLRHLERFQLSPLTLSPSFSSPELRMYFTAIPFRLLSTSRRCSGLIFSDPL